MKKYITLLAFLATISSFSQDETAEPDYFKFRPFLTNGVDFIQSDSLKTIYGTHSKYFFGGGFEVSVSDLSKVRLIIQFEHSSFVNPKTPDFSDVLKNNQLMIGFVVPFYDKDKVILTSIFGANFSKISETNYGINDVLNMGFRFGFGLERKMFKSTRIFSDLTYQYQKLNKAYSFRNFDMLKLSFGIKF